MRQSGRRIDRPPLAKQSPSRPSWARWSTAVSAVTSAAGGVGWLRYRRPPARTSAVLPRTSKVSSAYQLPTGPRSSAASADASRSAGPVARALRLDGSPVAAAWRRPARMRLSRHRSCPRRCGARPLHGVVSDRTAGLWTAGLSAGAAAAGCVSVVYSLCPLWTARRPASGHSRQSSGPLHGWWSTQPDRFRTAPDQAHAAGR